MNREIAIQQVIQATGKKIQPSDRVHKEHSILATEIARATFGATPDAYSRLKGLNMVTQCPAAVFLLHGSRDTNFHTLAPFRASYA